ncbi:TonB family protein [Variovorax sp. J22P271]|uniref:TonB family protein n=1 Tax=Variovorax davisae TaxID=3053515 RepID=UPI002578C355|nr:TonB family protein [Variovorax sp. J22P271]MDM0032056.1 TonB family protein [Variovorax sp. J22P271]
MKLAFSILILVTSALGGCAVDRTNDASAMGPLVVAPQALHGKNKPPIYPAIAKQNEQEGRVVIRVWIDAEGRPSKAGVRESSGHVTLDQAALDAVRAWDFLPGRRNAVTEGMWFNIPISFKLAERKIVREGLDAPHDRRQTEGMKPQAGRVLPSSIGGASAQDSPSRIPQNASVCDRIYADIAKAPEELQAVLDRCDWDTDAFVVALGNLNRMPPPAGLKSIVLKSRVDGRHALGVTYEIDVFFNPLQAYPHPIAFAKLEQLIAKVSTAYEVDRIEIVGYSDPNEREELAEMALDSKRAEFMRRYFVAAGVQPERITTTTGASRNENTTIGRARDRSAAVKVHVLRQD